MDRKVTALQEAEEDNRYLRAKNTLLVRKLAAGRDLIRIQRENEALRKINAEYERRLNEGEGE